MFGSSNFSLRGEVIPLMFSLPEIFILLMFGSSIFSLYSFNVWIVYYMRQVEVAYTQNQYDEVSAEARTNNLYFSMAHLIKNSVGRRRK